VLLLSQASTTGSANRGESVLRLPLNTPEKFRKDMKFPLC
jgi:hypothetical protein